jgi:hypothetical protein
MLILTDYERATFQNRVSVTVPNKSDHSTVQAKELDSPGKHFSSVPSCIDCTAGKQLCSRYYGTLFFPDHYVTEAIPVQDLVLDDIA